VRGVFHDRASQEAAEELRARGIPKRRWCLQMQSQAKFMAVPPGVPHECAPVGDFSIFSEEFQFGASGILPRVLSHHYDQRPAHLFRVSAGLDSMLWANGDLARCGSVSASRTSTAGRGPVMNRLFQGALEVGEAVRTETGAGRGDVRGFCRE